MKTKSRPGHCRLELKLLDFASNYYIGRIAKLQAAIARKPRRSTITMIGDGEIPADTALLIRSILLKRSPRTELITDARSSLTDAAVLVWLLGDKRIIRDDARVFFKRNPLADEEPVEIYAGIGEAEPKYQDSYTYVDPEDADYARVLQLIDEFLPVREFAGRVISVSVLREFGLVENAQVELLLATALAKPRIPKAKLIREKLPTHRQDGANSNN